ncbi:MAG: OadG family protein [Oscillospiraceae bacterium]|nr:OadG family protein [Oscillospiraceae bacterium]
MDMVHISLGTAGIVVVMGMGVVFLGLILLMFVVKLMSRLMMRKQKAEPVQASAPDPSPASEPAPGSAGDLKLYDTDPRDAAMIMAIVADSLGKPLNELRFKSIREIKD